MRWGRTLGIDTAHVRNGTKIYYGNTCLVHPESPRYCVSNFCVACRKEWNKRRESTWSTIDKDAHNKRRRGTDHQSILRDMYADENEKLKTAVVNVLTNGEGTCRHCGQGDIDMLCIDHVEDDGKQHRQVIPNRSV